MFSFTTRSGETLSFSTLEEMKRFEAKVAASYKKEDAKKDVQTQDHTPEYAPESKHRKRAVRPGAGYERRV